MEDNQIDVVQFESTTKVGKQGVIDLNDVNTGDEVLQRLKDTTGIGFGNENPNVVHKYLMRIMVFRLQLLSMLLMQFS